MTPSPDEDEEAEGEGEGAEEYGRRPRIGRRKLLALITAVLIVAGLGSYVLLFLNQPPVASFTYSAIDKRLTVSADTSFDPDGRIVSFAWNWGDGTTGTGIRAAHTYADETQYTVTLTVRDDRNAEGSKSVSLAIVIRPTADFAVEPDRMSITVDGSRSFSQTGGNIVSWAWDFGDGGVTTGERASHDYATSGRYKVTLTVTDASNRLGNVSHFVSPADTTVHVEVSDAFTAACPFESYWQWRYGTYGDLIVYNSPPCVDYYPWVLFTNDGPHNPSFLYTVYHRVSRVRNHPGYNLSDPIILPVNNSAVPPEPTSFVDFNYSVEYMGQEWVERLNNTPYAPNSGLVGDGFEMVMWGNITMDLTMTKRIFGIPAAATPAEAQAYWDANTGPPRKPGDIENFTARWLDTMGNGKYNIWAGFEWELVPDIVDLTATVSPSGLTKIGVWWEVYGLDALWMRLWYWGRASYVDAVNNPNGYTQVRPQGWAPEELCWCEHGRMVGNITDHLDLDYAADAAYQWMAWANPGPDGTWRTDDDLPASVYEPMHLDYVPGNDNPSPGAGKYPPSELDWWLGKQMVHGSPGSFNYGRTYEYILAGTRYMLKPGYTLTIRMPQGNIPWFDPWQSVWNDQTLIGDYSVTYAPITLRFVKEFPDPGRPEGVVMQPGTYFLWDSRTKVLSFAGPYDFGGRTGLPSMPEPWIEMQPEATG